MLLNDWLAWLGGSPCFSISGKARPVKAWRIVHVFATSRRDLGGRVPLWRGSCITWTERVIVVGWDFAAEVLHEQRELPASKENPVCVAGGRIRDVARRLATGSDFFAGASEILAHE